MCRRYSQDSPALGGGASVPGIGAEHVRQRIHVVSALLDESAATMTILARRWCNDYRYAVHVHFAVADLVEPCPCQSIICRRDGIGDCEVELIGSVSERVGSYVTRVTGWTTALDGFDHFEDGVCGWWCVARK